MSVYQQLYLETMNVVVFSCFFYILNVFFFHCWIDPSLYPSVYLLHPLVLQQQRLFVL